MAHATDRQFSPVRRKWRLFRTWSSGHPVWCAWQVTYRCNFRCEFCGYWRDEMGKMPELTVEQFDIGARKLAQFGTLMVSLAGGEPLLREDLPDIIRSVGRYHFPFMTTNGWLVNERSAAEIMQAGIWGVSVSIDYATPEKHDARRGVDGAWERAWRAVELLSAARVHKYQRVCVFSVLLDDNIDDCLKLIEMADQRNAYYLLQPYCHRKTGSRDHQHNNGAVSPRLLELFDRYNNFASGPLYISKFDEFLHGGVPNCKAGSAFFNIDSTGDVAICVEYKDQPVANLLTDGAATIRSRLRAAARGNECRDCWYNCRGEIEGLYTPYGVVKSLRHYILDNGRAKSSPLAADARARSSQPPTIPPEIGGATSL